MAYSEVYTRINWENEPSKATPLGASNLNRIDSTLKTIDTRVVELDTVKANQSTVLGLVKDWVMDEESGIITITKLDGTTLSFDLNIEKIPVSFDLSYDGILTMITDDGTVMSADIGSMIPVIAYNDTDTIAHSYTGAGVNKVFSFAVKEGSITEKYLQPNYLAEIKENANIAAENAELSKEHRIESANSADRAEQALSQIQDAVDSNIPSFTINFDTGHLEYTGGSIDFAVNQNTGHLEWEVAI